MKTFVSTFVVSLMILFLIPYTSESASIWKQIAFDRVVRKIQIHPKEPSLIYVTVKGEGILKTTDGGNNWQKLVFKEFKGIGPLSPFVIALHPTDTKILYGTAYVSPIGGLLPIKSNDGGESWEEIWQGLELGDFWDRARFETIAVDANDTETIYLGGTSGPGVYVSRDGGRSWSDANIPAGNGPFFFAISPLDSTVYALISTTQPGGYICRSLDRGRSWQMIFGTVDGIVSAIAIDPTTGFLYVHGTDLRRSHTGMYKSVDRGENWQSIDNGFPVVFNGLVDYRSAIAALAVDAQHPNTIYAATQRGVYRSQNAGESWEPFNDGLTSLNIFCIAVNPIDASVYAGTDNGFFKAGIAEGVVSVGHQGKLPSTWAQIKSLP